MSKIYEKVGPDVLRMIAETMRRNHPALADAEINIAATFVTKLGTEDEVLPTLKHAGASAAAVIRLTRKNQKVYVEHDAEITIDMYHWKDKNQEQRIALLDHELEHVVIARDRRGDPKLDDNGRPKLKLKPDDWTINGFRAVIERNGTNAPEYVTANSVYVTVTNALGTYASTTAGQFTLLPSSNTDIGAITGTSAITIPQVIVSMG
jgi:hypothetical protein